MLFIHGSNTANARMPEEGTSFAAFFKTGHRSFKENWHRLVANVLYVIILRRVLISVLLVLVLAGIAVADNVEKYLQDIKDENSSIREKAVVALGSQGDRLAEDPLIDASRITIVPSGRLLPKRSQRLASLHLKRQQNELLSPAIFLYSVI